ncbi:RnaseH domain, transposon factor [Desarmillaria ectypa]|nr:RnaseH domain, transposon factor [Desarmillaria ectypa]
MTALAMGATRATNHAKENEEVKHLHFFADNTSAIKEIFDPVPRTGQAYAIAFHRRIRQFLDSDPSHTVEVSWCPGRKDIQGNERTDYLAKRGAENPKHGRYATANRFPPSLRPTQHFLDLAGKREVYGQVLQCRTGHRYIGDENVDCPCGELFQTREHVIRECPLYEIQRGILQKVSRTLYLSDILGTKEGIAALGEFIEKSGAFTRSGEMRSPGQAPEMEEEEEEPG